MHELIRSNGFGPFYHDGLEFLRRIFVTVRDRDWCEVSPTQWNCRVKESERLIDVTARHTSELVDFEWQGTLYCSANGRELHFEIAGRALKNMDVCRVGMVVLHPVPFMTGAQVATNGPNGESRFVVPTTIVPQPIVDGAPRGMSESFSFMTIKHPNLGLLELDFTGDLFELEDQRNWGDASYKSYCTPLRVGFPRGMAEGTLIEHGLDARLTPARTGSVGQGGLAEESASPPAIARELKIGRVAPVSFETLEDPGWMLGWDHIRIDLDEVSMSRVDWVLARLPDRASLEVGLLIDTLSPLRAEVVAWLHANAKRISTLIVKDLERPLPTTATIVRVRASLRYGAAQRIPLLVAPNGYFVELNRGQAFEMDVDGVAFPVSSTVHGDDIDTILVNSRAVGDMVTTVRQLTGKARIAVSPLARYFSERSNLTDFPRINAPWLSAAIAAASSAGATSITFANDVTEGF